LLLAAITGSISADGGRRYQAAASSSLILDSLEKLIEEISRFGTDKIKSSLISSPAAY
jgi:hypothetical protein